MGIAALEDKIVQRAVGTVLNQIWEEDFEGFSCGFRPGRSQQGSPLVSGGTVPAAHRVLVCQFELPIPQFVSRLATMRRVLGSAADQNLFIATRATGHLLSAPQGLQHFLTAAQAAAAEIIILDPLYSTHDQFLEPGRKP